MMEIRVIPTARQCSEIDFTGKTAVVIDVLRASSVIITALARGAKAILPVTRVEEAFSLYANADNEVILGGEQQARIIEGFHLGNSPLEYTAETVGGKEVVLKTTNGTLAIHGSAASDQLVVGSFLNRQKIVDFLLSQNNDIVLVCAGTNGKFSMDDALCAGLLIDGFLKHKEASCCDLGQTLRAWASTSVDLRRHLSGCYHLNYLLSIGYELDVNYCLQLDAFDLLPVYKQGKVVSAIPV